MGQHHSTRIKPRLDDELVRRVVAVQVAFERHTLKPVFHLIGSRVETRRLSAMVRWSQRAPPRRITRDDPKGGNFLARDVAAAHVDPFESKL
jgi:hypothetical protein